MRKYLIVIGVVLALLVAAAGPTYPVPVEAPENQAPSGPDISRLLERWRARDGAAVVEVGTELSQVFVRAPGIFLDAMAEDPDSWSTWLNELSSHTFTVFREGGRADCEQLLKEMKATAASQSRNGRRARLARRLRARLHGVRIREIQ